MRFVHLNLFVRTLPYEKIAQFECGPNFVTNRLKTFENMIKKQGFMFWFRFWLTFCFDPGCDYLRTMQLYWPDECSKVNIFIHNNFLEGSVEDAAKYAFERAVASLKRIETAPSFKDKSPKSQFMMLLLEMSEMAFGAYLCTIFHEWLASDIDCTTETYWQIPEVYLHSDFKPGVLEMFLVTHWKDNLVPLLGVVVKDVPWILKLLYGANVKARESAFENTFQHFIEVMKSYRDDKRSKIQKKDESLQAKNYSLSVFGQNKFRSSSKENLTTKKMTNVKEVPENQCCNCLNFESFKIKLKMCRRCKNENWIYPRYYCTDECQMEHWFQHHYKEHITERKKRRLKLSPKKQLETKIQNGLQNK